MNQEFKKEWVAALRSGEFIQGKNALCADGKYCCLGVACELLHRKGLTPKRVSKTSENITYYGTLESSALLPEDVQQSMKIMEKSPLVFIPEDQKSIDSMPTYYLGKHINVAALNDNGVSFKDIADLIESSL